RPTTAGSTPKLRRSPTPPLEPLRARSPVRCSCSALSSTRRAGCISTSTRGRRQPGRRGPRAASARARVRSTSSWANAMDDPRLTPARGDLAARYLEGKVAAARFVEGETFEVIDAIAPLRERPAADAPLLTQALKGERVTIYDRNGEG